MNTHIMNKKITEKRMPVSFGHFGRKLAILSGVLVITSPWSEAADYTWNSSSSHYWQQNYWTPSA